MVRRWFYVSSAVVLGLLVVASLVSSRVLWALVIVAPVIAIGLHDAFQNQHTILKNFPLLGHGRYLLETIRPEIQQYFIESNIDAFPIDREFREVAYQRAKGELETLPFGTQRDVYRVGYEWCPHSIAPTEPLREGPRVEIGGPDCVKSYSASMLNISAMSFGALSKNAVLALNAGAERGEFAHNTGEGGISPYHLESGGDLIWQIGTGYFGCRTRDGGFDPEAFERQAAREAVRMIELKLSQGAKPGHGGILPAVKVSQEVAAIRGVPVGTTVVSPSSHRTFATPRGLLEFLSEMRRLARGKPVGFKLCIGRRSEFFALCKTMLETGITPDFITVDGGEGGTGAAPLEFSNSMGMPARDAWAFVHSVLTGTGLRDGISVVASGKIFTGFHMVRAVALGADLCVSARGMMFALGCIQALRCNSDNCPTGITTQNPALIHGLNVADKAERVERFHAGTVKGFLEFLAAMGLRHPRELGPDHVFRRVSDAKVCRLSEMYLSVAEGQMLQEGGVPEEWSQEWRASNPDRW